MIIECENLVRHGDKLVRCGQKNRVPDLLKAGAVVVCGECKGLLIATQGTQVKSARLHRRKITGSAPEVAPTRQTWIVQCPNPECAIEVKIPTPPWLGHYYRCSRCKRGFIGRPDGSTVLWYLWDKIVSKQEQSISGQRKENPRASELWWKKLDGVTFEKEVALLLEGRGYKVQRTGRSGDEGVDLLLTRDGKKIIVQCKAYKTHVAPAVVRDLYGSLHHHRANEAWLIATSEFSVRARLFAKGKTVRLVAIGEIIKDA